VPRAVLFDLEPGVIDAFRVSPLGEIFRPDNLVNQKRGRGKQLGHGPQNRALGRNGPNGTVLKSAVHFAAALGLRKELLPCRGLCPWAEHEAPCASKGRS
jgi:hypothetical protein